MSSKKGRYLIVFITFPVILLLIGLVLVSVALLDLPDVQKMKKCMTTSMNQVNLCPTDENYVPLKKISQYAIDAVIVSEDASFFDHKGFDWFEIRQSVMTNLKRGRLARGASTLTQQLAKNVFLDGHKTLTRKIREAFLTKEIESLFSKEEILERYFNMVEFGPNIYGINQASQYYFNKKPSDLNILEAAYMAFLLPNPKAHHTYFKQGFLTNYARQRILEICLRLYRFKKISRNDLDIANFKALEFPWKELSWTRNELMDLADEVLIEETGFEESTLPVIQEDLPDTDPDLPSTIPELDSSNLDDSNVDTEEAN